MKKSLSHYISDLYGNTESILTYGNFSIIKKNASLPKYLANPMDEADFIVYALQNGTYTEMGEYAGYKVTRVNVGTERVYVARSEKQVRFLLGVEQF
jgi:hypothetical protein